MGRAKRRSGAWSARLGGVWALGLVCALFVSVPAAGAQRGDRPARPVELLSTPERITRALERGRIDEQTANLYRAYALGRPERLPSEFRAAVPWDGTLVALELRKALERMGPGPAREAIEAIITPQQTAAAGPGTSTCLSSVLPMLDTFESEHFYVEYNALALGGDLDVADYVASLERSWSAEVTSFGWAAPPVLADSPPPGGKYHVRIDALGPGLYGFVSNFGTHAGEVGNNPSTAWDEGDADATCMVLNQDYEPFPGTPQQALDATTAHEFNHSLQFGYGALSGENVPDDSFVEGGATWMEDEVHDASNDNYNDLWPIFEFAMGEYSDPLTGDPSPYGYWITFRGLSERYGTGAAGGGEQLMQDFWEETSKNTGDNLTAMATALQKRGTTLADAYHAYAVAAKFTRPCGGGYAPPYCFEEAAGYVDAAGETEPHGSITTVGNGFSGAVEDNYALNWVELPAAGGPYDVTLASADAAGQGQLRATVSCDAGSALGIALFPLPAVVGPGATTTLTGFDPASCARPVAVITNQSQTAPNPDTITEQNYTLTTSSSSPASFALGVSRAGSGSGSVTSSPAGISCGSDCSHSYPAGAVVNLTASSAPGSTFGGWSGACSGAGSCSVTMNTAKSVTATFTQRSTMPPSGGAQPPRGSGPTAGSQTEANDAVGPAIRILSRRGRLTRAGVVRVRLSCPIGEVDGCAGTLTLRTLRRFDAGGLRKLLGISRRRQVVLGTRSFRIAAGRSAVVKMRLSRRNRRLVERLRRLRVHATATARDPAGNRTAARKVLTLVRPRRPR